MVKNNFQTWSSELELVWELKTEEDNKKFWFLMDSITGNEDTSYLNKLIDTVRLKDDFGLYESLYNAIWSFPEKMVAQILAKRLPEFQKRMGKHDQASRFYIPVPGSTEALAGFLEAAKQWTATERRTALTAIRNWSIEDENWEPVLEVLGKPQAKAKEDPIPQYWDESWRNRFEKAKSATSEFSISNIFWQKSKKDWLADLDFLIEVLTLDLGKNWRQIDAITNPLWFFAKTSVYPSFIKKLKDLQKEKLDKILANIQRVNKQKFKLLNDELSR